MGSWEPYRVLLKGFYGMLYECHFGSARCFLGLAFGMQGFTDFGFFVVVYFFVASGGYSFKLEWLGVQGFWGLGCLK